MLQELGDYNWECAFNEALGLGYDPPSDRQWRDHPLGTAEAVPPGSQINTEGFTREDVEELIGITVGENDEANWECAGKLKDGRWFFLSAGCDYTGWD